MIAPQYINHNISLLAPSTGEEAEVRLSSPLNQPGDLADVLQAETLREFDVNSYSQMEDLIEQLGRGLLAHLAQKNGRGETALHTLKNLSVLRLLVRHFGKELMPLLALKDGGHCTVLHRWSGINFLITLFGDFFRQLSDEECWLLLSSQNIRGDTIFHCLSWDFSLYSFLLSLLKERATDILKIQNLAGETIFHNAPSMEILNLLIATAGDKIDDLVAIQDKNGRNVLDAMTNRLVSLFKRLWSALRDKKEDIATAQDRLGKNILHRHVESTYRIEIILEQIQKPETVAKLLETVDHSGSTPIHLACRCKSVDVTVLNRFLNEAGSRFSSIVAMVDSRGNMPIHRILKGHAPRDSLSQRLGLNDSALKMKLLTSLNRSLKTPVYNSLKSNVMYMTSSIEKCLDYFELDKTLENEALIADAFIALDPDNMEFQSWIEQVASSSEMSSLVQIAMRLPHLAYYLFVKTFDKTARAINDLNPSSDSIDKPLLWFDHSPIGNVIGRALCDPTILFRAPNEPTSKEFSDTKRLFFMSLHDPLFAEQFEVVSALAHDLFKIDAKKLAFSFASAKGEEQLIGVPGSFAHSLKETLASQRRVGSQGAYVPIRYFGAEVLMLLKEIDPERRPVIEMLGKAVLQIHDQEQRLKFLIKMKDLCKSENSFASLTAIYSNKTKRPSVQLSLLYLVLFLARPDAAEIANTLRKMLPPRFLKDGPTHKLILELMEKILNNDSHRRLALQNLSPDCQPKETLHNHEVDLLLQTLFKSIDNRIVFKEQCWAVKTLLQLPNTLELLVTACREEHPEFKRELVSQLKILSANQIDTEDLAKLIALFDQSRSPDALFTYLGGLSTLMPEESKACLHDFFVFLKALSSDLQFIQNSSNEDVLDKIQSFGTFLRLRYSPTTPHLQWINAIDKTLIDRWQQLPDLHQLFDSISNSSNSEVKRESVASIIKRALLVDGHLKGFDISKLKVFFDADDAMQSSYYLKMQESAKKETASEWEKALVLVANLTTPAFEELSVDEKMAIVSKLSALLKLPEGHPFLGNLQDIESLIVPKKAQSTTLPIKISHDPIDLLLSGSDFKGSCQAIDGAPEMNRGLLGYLLNGHILPLGHKDPLTAGWVTRSLMRLVPTRRADGSEEVVILLERLYPGSIEQKLSSQLVDAAKAVARHLGVKLLSVEVGSGKPYDGMVYLEQGLSHCEYCDASQLQVIDTYPVVITHCHVLD